MEINTIAPARETVLFSGIGRHTYCAFPSTVRYGEKLLCMFKVGDAHMNDHGIIGYLLMEKDGTVLESGTAVSRPGLNLQNVEVLRFPDGSTRFFIDIQDPKSLKLRCGMIEGTVEGERGLRFSVSDRVFADRDGLRYGYAFDGCPTENGYLFLAMTFPELSEKDPVRAPYLLRSGPDGRWEKRIDLNLTFEGKYNESSICPFGKDFILALRGDREYSAFSRVTAEGTVLLSRKVLPENDGIGVIGRPSLFTAGNGLYCIGRGSAPGAPAEDLRLMKLDPDTLRIEKQTVLDAGAADGYYAEGYFDGPDFCVLTYKNPNAGEKPSVVLLRYRWSDIAG